MSRNDKIAKQAKDLLVGAENVKIAIVGSRSFMRYEHFVMMDQFIRDNLDDMTEIEAVVSGGADGADALGKMWAETYKIDYIEFPADWKMYGKAAGMIRNSDIVREADVVFAFWNGRSKGTRNSIKLAKEMGKTLHICHF